MAEVKAVSRVEAIQSGDDIKPVSREEYFLKKSIGQGGGSGGAGYTVETQSMVVIPEQSVETKDIHEMISTEITIAEGITDAPDTMTITFNGQEYVCEANVFGPGKVYGGGVTETGPDFSQYPFALGIGSEAGVGLHGEIYTESAGTYTVKATGEQKTVTPSTEFKQAVNKSVVLPTSYQIYTKKKTINNTGALTVGENTITKTYYGSLEMIDIDKIISIDPIFSDSATIKLKDFSVRFTSTTKLTLTWIVEATGNTSLPQLDLRVVGYVIENSGGGQVTPITPAPIAPGE